MQKPYIEEAAEVAANASVAVHVLLGGEGADVEFIPLKPQPANAEWLAGLKGRWPGRDLHSVGVLAMVDGAPKATFKEPVSLAVVSRLAAAFQVYCLSLAMSEANEAAAKAATDEGTEYDWHNRRYIN